MPSSEKKRKGAVQIEREDAGPPLPPDNSKLPPIQKILHVDFYVK